MPAPATTEPSALRASSRGTRLRPPIAVGATAALAALALHLRDPHVQGSWGVCPFRLGTGLDCPGCGTLRAVHALTEGDVVGALSSNLVTVALMPPAVVVWVLWVLGAWRGGGPALPGSPRTQLIAGVAVATALLVFGVVRNLPGAGWLLS